MRVKPGYGLSNPASPYSLPMARSSLPGLAHSCRLLIQLMPPPQREPRDACDDMYQLPVDAFSDLANSICESQSLTRASHVESDSNALPLFTPRLGFSYSVRDFFHTSRLVSWRDANTRNAAPFARTLTRKTDLIRASGMNGNRRVSRASPISRNTTVDPSRRQSGLAG